VTTKIKRAHGRRSQREIHETLDGFLTEILPEKILPKESGSKRERAAKLSALLLTIAGTGATGAAHAEDVPYGGPAELSIVPEESSVQVGDTITTDISLSGLSNQLIGGYDLTIDFNPSVLSVADVTFGPYLDGPLESFQGTNTSVSSQIEVDEVSFGDLANQTGNGTVPFFSITFDTLAAGTSALTFDPVANAGTLLSDQNGVQFTNFEVLDSSVTVTPASVITAAPELDATRASGAITILVAAFLIVAERRRRI
jgi:hypothetical protein